MSMIQVVPLIKALASITSILHKTPSFSTSSSSLLTFATTKNVI